ncbi:MAG TPA: winged helix-turn-helix domain-containing protein, partial [Rhodocyclaceae bacterium]|nr:winged helix-turn-helix domain-containing protein [Rhodocyclaceae bacterium]
AAAEKLPDLVILDLGLVDGDGQKFIAEFRVWSQRPILVLSARQGEYDKVAALDAGADDFLSKPFSVAELLARVRALLRRIDRERSGGEAAIFRFDGVEIDLARHQVKRDGQDVHLTALEFRLLAVLVANAGKVMTHRHLLREVWGDGHAGDSHYLRVYVGHLRQKLEIDPALPAHLLTEVGVGYRFVF